VNQAVAEFGGLDVMINNAGMVRDNFLAGLTEHEWDAVIDVHLEGHMAPPRFAAEYWKNQSNPRPAGEVRASVINTSSRRALLCPTPARSTTELRMLGSRIGAPRALSLGRCWL
jgi:NAD(P)-dependent dehydrogenase (short-subunit alcohol dehydrogenase family)